MIYINDIYKYRDIIKRKYHDIFYIFDIFFIFFSKYQPLLLLLFRLLTFLFHAYLTQTAQVTNLLDAAKYFRKF